MSGSRPATLRTTTALFFAALGFSLIPATALADCSGSGPAPNDNPATCTYVPIGSTEQITPIPNPTYYPNAPNPAYNPACAQVTDNCPADIMVPYATQAEWGSFIDNHASCEGVVPCECTATIPNGYESVTVPAGPAYPGIASNIGMVITSYTLIGGGGGGGGAGFFLDTNGGCVFDCQAAAAGYGGNGGTGGSTGVLVNGSLLTNAGVQVVAAGGANGGGGGTGGGNPGQNGQTLTANNLSLEIPSGSAITAMLGGGGGGGGYNWDCTTSVGNGGGGAGAGGAGTAGSNSSSGTCGNGGAGGSGSSGGAGGVYGTAYEAYGDGGGGGGGYGSGGGAGGNDSYCHYVQNLCAARAPPSLCSPPGSYYTACEITNGGAPGGSNDGNGSAMTAAGEGAGPVPGGLSSANNGNGTGGAGGKSNSGAGGAGGAATITYFASSCFLK